MKARTVGVTVALAAGLGLGGTAQAALYDRGGGLIYDSVLNITWLQDANHAVGDLSRPGRIANIIANVGTVAGHTLVAADFDAFTGQMTWWGAVAWADELEYRDVLRGVVWDDWRLPVTRPLDGVNYRIGPNIYDGTSDFGYNVSAEGTVYSQSTASELASLFYRSDGLHGISYCSTQGVCPSTDWYQKFPLSDLFVALQYGAYWSSPEYPAGVGYAWLFDLRYGWQGTGEARHATRFAWAVRDGDVGAVPIPSTAWLLGSALALAGIGLNRGRYT